MANQTLYGFHTIKDLAQERLTDQLVPQVQTAIQMALAEYERQKDSFLALFVMRTTQYKLQFKTTAKMRLQPLDEQGRARPVQIFGKYDVAWPLQKAGIAWGLNRQARAKMTVADAERLTAAFLTADWLWLLEHILAALYTNVTWTYTDDEYGALTISGLANNDSVTYQLIKGAAGPSTADHYLAQASDIDDTHNPYPTIYTKLSQRPENAGKVICLIPSNLKDDTMALANFHEAKDPNIDPGANASSLIGSLGVEVPGTVIGYTDKCWIVEWESLPDDYIIAVTSEGEKPLAFREEPEAELQGFAQVAQRLDHPFEETHWERIGGFGAWNRVGALVYRIGNGTYAIPSGYDSPLP
ncbi:MAG: hypothetical protein J0I20_35750 [Chloroflexi bacterium]|nr:hypothetical protein [Chloroflexota bacterium]OJV86959.1 MAG: hypothetical protein BGO39_28565 [Chloroflexi bacterium 54-19]